MTARNDCTQTRRGNSVRRHGGGEERSRHMAFIEADVLQRCPRSLHVRAQRFLGTIEAEPTRGEGTVEVWVS